MPSSDCPHLPPFFGTPRQQRPHAFQQRRLEGDLADVATCRFQHLVEGLAVPIREILWISVIFEPLDGMAYYVSLGCEQTWYVLGKIQIPTVQGMAEIDLVRRHDWAIAGINREASHQID